MAATSLASTAALQRLAGATSRLTTAATCAAKDAPHKRGHSADSPTVNARGGHKLGLGVEKNALHFDREKAPRLQEHLHLACWGNSWGDSKKAGREPGRFLFVCMERQSHIL